MSDSANVSPTEREILAARDAGPLSLDVLKAFVQAHRESNLAAINDIAITAAEVIRTVNEIAVTPLPSDEGESDAR